MPAAQPFEELASSERHLTNSTAILVIGSEWLDLSCLQRGDPIRVAAIGMATSICRVASVEYAEPDSAQG
jgi:hypothetical protein